MRRRRRRPWIVLAVPIVVLCVWRLFMPPEGVGLFYLLAWLVLGGSAEPGEPAPDVVRDAPATGVDLAG